MEQVMQQRFRASKGTGLSARRDESKETKARIRVMAFGQHLRQHARGVLVMCPNAPDHDFNQIKALLVRSAFGADFDYADLDYANIQLLLLPTGEVLTSADMLCTNDRVVVLLSRQTFDGVITNIEDVRRFLEQQSGSAPGTPLAGGRRPSGGMRSVAESDDEPTPSPPAEVVPDDPAHHAVVFSDDHLHGGSSGLPPRRGSLASTGGGEDSAAASFLIHRGDRDAGGAGAGADGAQHRGFAAVAPASSSLPPPPRVAVGPSASAPGGSSAWAAQSHHHAAVAAAALADRAAAASPGGASVASGFSRPDDGSGGATSPGGGRRRRSVVCQSPGTVKMRRAVQKLGLIRRFNQSATAAVAEGAVSTVMTLGSARSARSAGGSSRNVQGASIRTKKHQRRLGRAMDAYVREQSNLYDYGAKRRVIEDDESVPWYLLRADTSLKLLWDVTVLILVVYAAFVVPIRIGFDTLPSPSAFVFERIGDCLFILDMVASFLTIYKVDGVMVLSCAKISQNYLSGWFTLDLLATFPIHWITETWDIDYGYTGAGSAASSGTSSGSVGNLNMLLRMLRLFKLFRLLRLVKLFPKLFAALETSIKIDPAILRFMRSFIVLTMMWHLMGCSYWFVVRQEYGSSQICPPELTLTGNTSNLECFVNWCLCAFDQGDPLSAASQNVTVLPGTDPTFVFANTQNTWLPPPQYAGFPLSVQYWNGLFWSIMVTTSIGNLNPPFTTTESAFTMVMILGGLMMYSIVLGSAASALGNLDATGAAQKKMLDDVLAYMRSRKVPNFFQRIIVDFYNHQWQENRGDAEVLDMLPGALRSKLNMIINRDVVEKIPVLGLMPVEVYLKMVLRLTSATYLPGDYIVRQGEPGDQMLFIKSGKVDAVLPNGVSVFMTLRPGDFFGEKSMLFMTRRDASYRAVDFVDVLVMDRADFTEMYITAPEFVRELQKTDAARDKLRLKQELLAADLGSHGGGSGRRGSLQRRGSDASFGGGRGDSRADTEVSDDGFNDTVWIHLWRCVRHAPRRALRCCRQVRVPAAVASCCCCKCCSARGAARVEPDAHHYKWRRYNNNSGSRRDSDGGGSFPPMSPDGPSSPSAGAECAPGSPSDVPETPVPASPPSQGAKSPSNSFRFKKGTSFYKNAKQAEKLSAATASAAAAAAAAAAEAAAGGGGGDHLAISIPGASSAAAAAGAGAGAGGAVMAVAAASASAGEAAAAAAAGPPSAVSASRPTVTAAFIRPGFTRPAAAAAAVAPAAAAPGAGGPGGPAALVSHPSLRPIVAALALPPPPPQRHSSLGEDSRASPFDPARDLGLEGQRHSSSSSPASPATPAELPGSAAASIHKPAAAHGRAAAAGSSPGGDGDASSAGSSPTSSPTHAAGAIRAVGLRSTQLGPAPRRRVSASAATAAERAAARRGQDATGLAHTGRSSGSTASDTVVTRILTARSPPDVPMLRSGSGGSGGGRGHVAVQVDVAAFQPLGRGQLPRLLPPPPPRSPRTSASASGSSELTASRSARRDASMAATLATGTGAADAAAAAAAKPLTVNTSATSAASPEMEPAAAAAEGLGRTADDPPTSGAAAAAGGAGGGGGGARAAVALASPLSPEAAAARALAAGTGLMRRMSGLWPRGPGEQEEGSRLRTDSRSDSALLAGLTPTHGGGSGGGAAVWPPPRRLSALAGGAVVVAPSSSPGPVPPAARPRHRRASFGAQPGGSSLAAHSAPPRDAGGPGGGPQV